MEGGVEAVPEGDPELLAGLVSVLRRGGPAEDEQLTWSTLSAAIATTSVGPVVGGGPRRVWS